MPKKKDWLGKHRQYDLKVCKLLVMSNKHNKTAHRYVWLNVSVTMQPWLSIWTPWVFVCLFK